MVQMSKTVADLRAMFKPKVPGGPIVIRPSSRFYEVTQKEITAAIDEVERLFVRKELGDPPNALEQLALIILSESYF